MRNCNCNRLPLPQVRSRISSGDGSSCGSSPKQAAGADQADQGAHENVHTYIHHLTQSCTATTLSTALALIGALYVGPGACVESSQRLRAKPRGSSDQSAATWQLRSERSHGRDGRWVDPLAILQHQVLIGPCHAVHAKNLRKTAFLSHLYLKTNILPRQARDKHRESTQKKMPFFAPAQCSAVQCSAVQCSAVQCRCARTRPTQQRRASSD